jgi:hypothetical protein
LVWALAEPSRRIPVSVFRRRGTRLSTTLPLRGLARPMTSVRDAPVLAVRTYVVRE